MPKSRKRSVKRKNKKRSKSSKRINGGGMQLAYTGKPIPLPHNPFLSYLGKGGQRSNAYPNPGPPPNSNIQFNSARPSIGGNSMKGGDCGCNSKLFGGMKGFVGNPINLGNTADLPGVDGIPGDRNYFPLNEYHTDVARQIQDVGPNPPFTGGNKRKKGGALSNLMGQDFINFGRQMYYGANSSYNMMKGYPAPVNPLPWKDQLTHK